MRWYRVTKTIKGHPYFYLQRTWREGKQVRTKSIYLCPAYGSLDSVIAPSTGEPTVSFFGSREGFTGEPRASEEGTFGPGLYLTTEDRAKLYAHHDAGDAAKALEYWGSGETFNLPPPKYDGTVVAFDLSELHLVRMKWGAYYHLMSRLMTSDGGAATPENRKRLQAELVQMGFDGIQIDDEKRKETVIFPGALGKLKRVNTTDI